MAKSFRFLGIPITVGKRLYGMGNDTDDYFHILQSKYGTDARSYDRLNAYKGVVYGMMTLVGEQFGSYQPIIKRQQGDDLVALKAHPFYDLLKRPGGTDIKAASMSRFDLFEATGSFLWLQGEVYWYMAKGVMSGKPREVVVLRADKVGIDIDKSTGDINGYFVRRANGDPIPMDVEDVLHFKLFNPKDPYHGMGKIQGGEVYIGTDEAASTFTRNFFNNNAGLSGVLNIKGEVTKGAFKKFVRAWRDKYQGVDNAGKVAILRESDATFTKVGLGLNELDMSALKKMTLQDIAIVMRVPLELLGVVTDGAGLGRGNIETLEYIFTKYAIEPNLKRFDALMQIAIERYYGGTDLVVEHKNITPEDKEFELNRRDKGVDRWLTRNEIRDEDGHDSIDGGDTLMVPINSIPLNDAGMGTTDSSKSTGKTLRLKLKRQAPEEPKKKVATKPKP